MCASAQNSIAGGQHKNGWVHTTLHMLLVMASATAHPLSVILRCSCRVSCPRPRTFFINSRCSCCALAYELALSATMRRPVQEVVIEEVCWPANRVAMSSPVISSSLDSRPPFTRWYLRHGHTHIPRGPQYLVARAMMYAGSVTRSSGVWLPQGCENQPSYVCSGHAVFNARFLQPFLPSPHQDSDLPSSSHTPEWGAHKHRAPAHTTSPCASERAGIPKCAIHMP